MLNTALIMRFNHIHNHAFIGVLYTQESFWFNNKEMLYGVRLTRIDSAVDISINVIFLLQRYFLIWWRSYNKEWWEKAVACCGYLVILWLLCMVSPTLVSAWKDSCVSMMKMLFHIHQLMWIIVLDFFWHFARR